MKKTGLYLLAALWIGFPAGESLAQESFGPSLPGIVETGGKAVGLVATLDAEGNYVEKLACFFVGASGVLVTTYQPLADADGVEVILPDGRKSREVSIINVDLRKDIAILKVPADGVPILALGDSDRTRAGEGVVILSRPLGTFIKAMTGVVSAVRDSKRGLKLHQLSLPVDSTAAGGPALNQKGEVIGMVSYYRLFNESLGFAVPINYVRGLLSDKPTMTFAEFAKVRKPFQPFDPALLEAKRLAVIEKVRVASFQMRETRVRWEQVNEVAAKLRSELLLELNAYGSTASEIFLADPFEVAEHRRLTAALYFSLGDIFAVDAPPETLFPLCYGMLSSVPPSVFPPGSTLYGKKGEVKGPVSKITMNYALSAPVGTATVGSIELLILLGRLMSTEEMPNLSLNVFFKDPAEGKEKEAESVWSNDAYSVHWGDIRELRFWDLQEKVREWKRWTRQEKAKSSGGSTR